MEQGGDAKTLKSSMPKDVEVANYTFREMYEWCGLDLSRGYFILDSRTQMNALESMITTSVLQLPHIKFNNGFLVKMFQ